MTRPGKLSAMKHAVILLGLGLLGCHESIPSGPLQPPEPAVHICTAMPCSSQATITARMTPAVAARGTHTFRIEGAEHPITCVVEFAGEQSRVFAECAGGGASLHFGPVMRSVEVPSPVPGTVMVGEVPVEGEFSWSVDVYGTPGELRVVHTFDGREISNRNITLSYHESRPNGPGCEPVCQAAEATLN